MIRLALVLAVVTSGCGSDDMDAVEKVAALGFCDGGLAASTSGAALITRSAGSYRGECLSGVYENTGLVSGGDFYTNEYISRMELRPTQARAAIRCTFEGPLSNPPAEREARDVLSEVMVPLAVNDWGIEFLSSATDTTMDPYYISSCATELPAGRWPFCVAPVDAPELINVPDGETFCVFLEAGGKLQSITQGATTQYKQIATKISD